jgi:hypothetical protein
LIHKSIISIKRCRLCKSDNLKKCFSFPKTPLANDFLKKKKFQKKYPLDIYICIKCRHVQLKHVVNPNLLFSNYLYVSGTSSSFVEHFRDYAYSVISKNDIKKNDLILEIGSNDGVLLNSFKLLGYKNILGIEPAKKISEVSNKSGIRTINSFFNLKITNKINQKFGLAKIIIANNVFAHIDDFDLVFNNINLLLSDNGVIYFEVSYLLDVLKKNLFDTIYHEHLSYHSVTPIINFLKSKNLFLIDYKRVNTHGGSIRFIVSKNKALIKKNKINKIINLEKLNKVNQFSTYNKFYNQIMIKKKNLLKKLISLKAQNKKIIGYGAPAKMTTLIYTLDLHKYNLFKFIIDDSPLKQNLYSPGLNIKIVSSKYLDIKKADVCVVFAWNFFKQIEKKHFKWKRQGGIFINPLE